MILSCCFVPNHSNTQGNTANLDGWYFHGFRLIRQLSLRISDKDRCESVIGAVLSRKPVQARRDSRELRAIFVSGQVSTSGFFEQPAAQRDSSRNSGTDSVHDNSCTSNQHTQQHTVQKTASNGVQRRASGTGRTSWRSLAVDFNEVSSTAIRAAERMFRTAAAGPR